MSRYMRHGRTTPNSGNVKVPRGVDRSVRKSTQGHWFCGRKLEKNIPIAKNTNILAILSKRSIVEDPPFYWKDTFRFLSFRWYVFHSNLTPKHLKNRQRCPWKMWDHHTTRHHRKRLRILHHQPGAFTPCFMEHVRITAVQNLSQCWHGNGLKLCLCVFRHSISFELYKTVSCDMNSESRNFQWFLASCRIFSYRGHRTVFPTCNNSMAVPNVSSCRTGKLGNRTRIRTKVRSPKERFFVFFCQAPLGI